MASLLFWVSKLAVIFVAVEESIIAVAVFVAYVPVAVVVIAVEILVGYVQGPHNELTCYLLGPLLINENISLKA